MAMALFKTIRTIQFPEDSAQAPLPQAISIATAIWTWSSRILQAFQFYWEMETEHFKLRSHTTQETWPYPWPWETSTVMESLTLRCPTPSPTPYPFYWATVTERFKLLWTIRPALFRE